METNTNRIEIPLNKRRLILLLISALAFVGIGIWFATKPDSFRNGLLGNPTIVSGIGLLSIVVFGLSFVVVLKKYLDNSPGLIIDQTGITDNSSGISAGHIPWSDIKEITTTKVFNQKFLTINLKKPEPGKKDAAVSIAVTTLKYDFNELEAILKAQFAKNKTK